MLAVAAEILTAGEEVEIELALVLEAVRCSEEDCVLIHVIKMQRIVKNYLTEGKWNISRIF